MAQKSYDKALFRLISILSMLTNKAKAIIIVLHFFANKFKYLQFIKQCKTNGFFCLKIKLVINIYKI